jgi:hypothetical protein
MRDEPSGSGNRTLLYAEDCVAFNVTTAADGLFSLDRLFIWFEFMSKGLVA